RHGALWSRRSWHRSHNVIKGRHVSPIRRRPLPRPPSIPRGAFRVSSRPSPGGCGEDRMVVPPVPSVGSAPGERHRATSAVRDRYLLLTDSGDHGARARSRKAMIAAGWSHTLAGPFDGMVYTAIQEAATRTFYLCAARACGEEQPALAAALRRIAKDETLHMA